MKKPQGRTSHWRLIACDLDGTLIGWNHKINDRDLEALRAARRAGFGVAICTGRNALECAGILGALNLPTPLGLGVFANGAMIAAMDDGKTAESTAIDQALAEDAVDFFGSRGHAVLLLCDDPRTRLPRYVMTDHGPPHWATTEWLLYNKVHALPVAEVPEELHGRIVRLGIVVNVDQAAELHADMTTHFGGRAATHSIYSPHFDCQILEFFHPRVNKWTGLEALARHMGIGADQIVTIGDDINDVHMLEGARLSFAMGSAAPEIQRRAKRVTAPQAECGVAEVVEGVVRGMWEPGASR